MKTFALLLALSLAPFAAAQTASLLASTSFYRFQCSPTFAADGTPVSAVTQAFWQTTVTDSTGAVIATSVTQGAQWDAVAKAASTVAVGAKTYTYGEVLAAVMAIATQEKAAASAPPTP